jgi:hypothetical protein
MSKSNKAMPLVTPVGVAVYPKLVEPDTAFNDAGEYKCRLHVTEKEYKAFRKGLDPLVTAAYKAEVEAQGGKDVRKAPMEPVRVTPEGDFEINAKQKAKVVLRSGETLEFTVALFDSKAQPIMDRPKIGSGSKIRLSVTFNPWFVPSQGWGYTLRLREAQIIELVEYSASASTNFSAVDGGYETTAGGGEGFNEVLTDADDAKKVAPF